MVITVMMMMIMVVCDGGHDDLTIAPQNKRWTLTHPLFWSVTASAGPLPSPFRPAEHSTHHAAHGHPLSAPHAGAFAGAQPAAITG
jgi:hypothetical protein